MAPFGIEAICLDCVTLVAENKNIAPLRPCVGTHSQMVRRGMLRTWIPSVPVIEMIIEVLDQRTKSQKNIETRLENGDIRQHTHRLVRTVGRIS